MCAELQDRSVEQVVADHLQAFAQGDIDGLLRDYRQDAVIIAPTGVFTGHQEIKGFFENACQMLPPGCAFDMAQQTVENDIACIVWSAESDVCRVPFGTDTFVIRDGMIVAQTFAGMIEEKG